MNISFSIGASIKNALYNKTIDFDKSTSSPPGDTFRALLMREGFSFNSSVFKKRADFKSVVPSPVDIVVSTQYNTIRRTTGSFVTDGFKVGNYITTDNSSNDGWFKINAFETTTNANDTARVTKISGDFTAGSYSGVVIAADDEYAYDGTGSPGSYTKDGYTQGGIEVFFTIDGNTLTLDSFDFPALGAVAITISPGIIIYDDTHADDIVVAYGVITPWTMTL